MAIRLSLKKILQMTHVVGRQETYLRKKRKLKLMSADQIFIKCRKKSCHMPSQEPEYLSSILQGSFRCNLMKMHCHSGSDCVQSHNGKIKVSFRFRATAAGPSCASKKRVISEIRVHTMNVSDNSTFSKCY